MDGYVGIRKHAVDFVPAYLWGVSDDFSIFFNAPFAISYKENEDRSTGWEDLFVQFEYAYYNKKTYTYNDQGTVVFNASFPTGSSLKKPPTGFGSPAFFFGTTFNRTYVDWFFFASPGFEYTTPNFRNTKLGNEYFYEFGFGKNIFSVKDELIVSWMIEFDGFYANRNRIEGFIDLNSGGNVIYATPSLWISTKKLIIQLGAGGAISQNLFGNQKRENYLLIANFGYTL